LHYSSSKFINEIDLLIKEKNILKDKNSEGKITDKNMVYEMNGTFSERSLWEMTVKIDGVIVYFLI
jgi:hypothetical protein